VWWNRNKLKETGIWGLMDSARRWLYRIAFVFCGAFCLAWGFRSDLTALANWPVNEVLIKTNSKQILYGVLDLFMTHIKVSFYFTLLLLVPFLVFVVWRIVKQKLKGAKLGIWKISPYVAILLFLSGFTFTLFILLPQIYEFLITYSTRGEGLLLGHGDNSANDVLRLSMRDQVGVSLKLALAGGLAFEIPFVLTIGGRLGILQHHIFKKQRGLVLVALAILSALLTPPDPFSMLIMLGPLYSLFELGLLGMWLAGRKKENARSPEASYGNSGNPA